LGLGEERCGHWSKFQLGNDELGCDMTRRNAPKVHDGESKGIDNTVVTRATGLQPLWLGQGQSTIHRHSLARVCIRPNGEVPGQARQHSAKGPEGRRQVGGTGIPGLLWCVLAMNPCPEKAELGTSGEHERTEEFSPSGVRASACRTTAVQSCGCRQRAGTRRRTSNKGMTQLQGKGARAAMTAAAPASDRLGSMAGSQATAGLRGGAVRDSGQHTNNELTWLGPASARRPGPQQGRGG
jgi:hypothetical protein